VLAVKPMIHQPVDSIHHSLHTFLGIILKADPQMMFLV